MQLEEILNYFLLYLTSFVENVNYNSDFDCFVLIDDDEVVGYITKENYLEVCSIILQMNRIDSKDIIDLSKVKNKKGLARILRMQKLKQQAQKTSKTSNPDMELGNIISAVCAMHNSLNYKNIWDLTIYQLWDTFDRLQNQTIYNSNLFSVSVWGDKEKKFKFNDWFKNINHN